MQVDPLIINFIEENYHQETVKLIHKSLAYCTEEDMDLLMSYMDAPDDSVKSSVLMYLYGINSIKLKGYGIQLTPPALGSFGKAVSILDFISDITKERIDVGLLESMLSNDDIVDGLAETLDSVYGGNNLLWYLENIEDITDKFPEWVSDRIAEIENARVEEPGVDRKEVAKTLNTLIGMYPNSIGEYLFKVEGFEPGNSVGYYIVPLDQDYIAAMASGDVSYHIASIIVLTGGKYDEEVILGDAFEIIDHMNGTGEINYAVDEVTRIKQNVLTILKDVDYGV